MRESLRPEYRPTGLRRDYDPLSEIALERGSGCWVWDLEGRKYLDAISGYSATGFGHAHPRLIQAMRDQAAEIAFTPNAESQIRKKFEELLCTFVSNSEKALLAQSRDSEPRELESVKEEGIFSNDRRLKVWLCSTGARAAEIAWKIVHRARPGRIVRFDLSFHGRSLATAVLSDTPALDIITPSHQIDTIPFPVPKANVSCEEACHESLSIAEQLFLKHGTEISAMFLEPAIGARGYYFAPDWYFVQLVALARRHRVLVISDEIQMGLGRLGGGVASHVQGWIADLYVFGKTLGGGIVPLSAVVGEGTLIDQLPPGIESETFAGNPLACRLGCEVISMLGQERYIQESSSWHSWLRDALRKMTEGKGVYGVGSATVLALPELITSQRTRAGGSNVSNARCQTIGAKYCSKLRERGVLAHLTGPDRDRIALILPLIASRCEFHFLLDAISEEFSSERDE